MHNSGFNHKLAKKGVGGRKGQREGERGRKKKREESKLQRRKTVKKKKGKKTFDYVFRTED